MKVNMIKSHGGVLIPSDDSEQERLNRFKTGELYQIEIKLTRNPAFLRKAFAFFNFCFAHWKSDQEFLDEKGQFEHFRKELTVTAGFWDRVVSIDGSIILKAKSLAFASMEEEEFSQCYNALIQAAITNIFIGADESTIDKLYGFF